MLIFRLELLFHLQYELLIIIFIQLIFYIYNLI